MLTCSTLTSQTWRQCSRQAAGRSWCHPGHTLPCWRREASLPHSALAAGSAPPHGPTGPVMDPTDCWDTLPLQHRAHAGEEKNPTCYWYYLEYGMYWVNLKAHKKKCILTTSVENTMFCGSDPTSLKTHKDPYPTRTAIRGFIQPWMGLTQGWRPTNLVHWWSSDGVSQQLAVEWAINTFIHVVQELSIFIVLSCINIMGDHVRDIEHTVLFTN